MKLLHTADLHIDSPLLGLAQEKREKRRLEILDSFRRIVDLAKKEGVTAILISGDLFDRIEVSSEAEDYVISLIAGTDIQFYYLSGNHDMSISLRRPIPKNLYLFDDSWKTYELSDGVTVSATENPDFTEPFLPEDRFNIVMLHGLISESQGKDIIDIRKLRFRNIDYLALGHIHSFRVGKLDERGSWGYPGIPEGRGYDESGKHGVIILNTDDCGQKTIQFYDIAKRHVADRAIDISGLENISEIYARIMDGLNEGPVKIKPEDLVRIRLNGRIRHMDMLEKLLEERLSDEYFDVSVKDQTETLLETEKLLKERSLKGAFAREIMKIHDGEEALKILEMGIKLLDGGKL